MCTDVDRNDKSRICAPGSVKVIGRRQIEMYSVFEGGLRRARCLSVPHVGGDGDGCEGLQCISSVVLDDLPDGAAGDSRGAVARPCRV